MGLMVTTGLAAEANSSAALVQRTKDVLERRDVLKRIPDVFHYTTYERRAPGNLLQPKTSDTVDIDACATATEITAEFSAIVADVLAGREHRAERTELLDALDDAQDSYCNS
jgi:hypothetical protein